MTQASRLSARLTPRPDYAAPPPVASTEPPDIRALYVHVPFCSTKCHYCDFYSIAGHLDQADDYLQALASEIDLWKSLLGPIAPETLFIGGGTPTLLDPDRLDRLLSLVRSILSPSARPLEWAIEANPNTFDAPRAAVLAGHGVNRISFGAQSFIPAELLTLQRDHDPDNVPKAFAIAREANIHNLNVDLIFGIPGQTLDSWEFSLSQALALNPSHMSCYSLTYEPNTAMTARMHKGEFAPIDEELELAMFQHVYARLKAAGFTRYEISNYARPGKECRHNLHYWKGSNWLALGPAAAGHLNRHRWKNVASLNHYMEALGVRSTGFSLRGGGGGEVDTDIEPETTQPEGCTPNLPILPLTQMEHLTPQEWAAETAIFWLRLSEGLNYAEFEERTALNARPLLEPALQKYAAMDLVELTPESVRLTEKAVPISNRILRDALAAFDESPNP